MLGSCQPLFSRKAALPTSFLQLCLPELSLCHPHQGLGWGTEGGLTQLCASAWSQAGWQGWGGVSLHVPRVEGGGISLNQVCLVQGRSPSLPLPPGAAPAADRVWSQGNRVPFY